MLSLEDPTRVLHRTDKSFFKPEMQYEKTGQVANVCFLEGLVYYKGEWLLYYGQCGTLSVPALVSHSSTQPQTLFRPRHGRQQNRCGEVAGPDCERSSWLTATPGTF